MKFIKNERVIFFDIDKTLVIPKQDAVIGNTIAIQDPYDDNGNLTYRVPHKPHIKLLKNYHARGAYVIVWSKNGYQWAYNVLHALNLIDCVSLVMSKPFAFVDDHTSDKWMGEHIYIDPTDSFGQEKK